MAMDEKDLDDLRTAAQLLEHPGLAIQLSNLIGSPLEKGLKLLPAGASELINAATHKSLQTALNLAVRTLKPRVRGTANLWHKLAVTMTGAAGGAFGLAALAVELPLSTTIMLRSIADIARAQGEQLDDISARLACLEVFAVGGPTRADDAAEAGYLATRAALARFVSEAAQYITERGLTEGGAPVLVRLIARIASRFGAAVAEKVAAQAVPAVGAVGGAALNLLFIDHFQHVAQGHFIVRRLERKYGSDIIHDQYQWLQR